MKTKHLVMLSLFIIGLSSKSIAQEIITDDTQYSYRTYPDSICVEFPEQKALLVFRMKNIKNNDSIFVQFPKYLEQLLTEIDKGIADEVILYKVAVKNVNTNYRDITITEQKDATTKIISHENQVIQLRPPGWEIEVVNKQASIYIYAPTFQDLVAITKQNFTAIQDSITNEKIAHRLNRHGLISRLVVQDNKVVSESHKHRPVQDYISLNLSAGFGFVNDKFYPYFDGIFSIVIPDRTNVNRHKIDLMGTSMFFATKHTDGTIKSKTSPFISIAYNLNLNTRSSKSSWFGIGAGLSDKKQDGIFTGRTARFFLNKSIGSFTFRPQIYFTNNFKDQFRGLEVSFSF